MGCAASCIQSTTMSLFGRHSHASSENNERANIERKLYLAKESPEPLFDLSDCQLREVPSGIYSLCKVYRKELLCLHNNKLTTLQHGGSLSDLYLMRVLNISHNNLSKLPSEIKYLVSLTELYVQNNNIKSLPDSIECVKSLQIIDASNNSLRQLTSSLGKLKNLQILRISGNKDLRELCPELCYATNISCIELDSDQYIFPPCEVVTRGTEEIMKFLCDEMNVEYTVPSQVDISVIEYPKTVRNPFVKQSSMSWEELEAAQIEQENKFHEAAKLQKEKFLSQVVQEQTILDAEIAKVQEAKDVERLRLIREIQDEEKEIESLVENFIQSVNLKPEVVQQQLQHEQDEHDRLLEIVRQNYDNVRKVDVLKAMEKLLDENCSTQDSKRNYQSNFDNIKQSMLVQELESTEKLEQLYRTKDQSRTVLINQLLEDQDVQKAVVASLVEKVDARTWSLNQEISLVSSNLMKLSVIEQEKKKLRVAYNFNELLHQRTQLLNLLEDLTAQQAKRRAQLLETMKEMEYQKDCSTDYWLKNYQRLLESAPESLLGVGKSLDPMFANYLLQEGVIHCLPFLFKFLFSETSLLSITPEKLKASGVSLPKDRDAIMKAISLYVFSKSENHNFVPDTYLGPSAPQLSEADEQSFKGVVDAANIDSSIPESECVICMDAICEVVFVPCGHLCCCQPCSEQEMESCPMCRGYIERKIKLIIV